MSTKHVEERLLEMLVQVDRGTLFPDQAYLKILELFRDEERKAETEQLRLFKGYSD